MPPAEANDLGNTTEHYRHLAGTLIQALCRVVAVFLRKVGHKPSNLMLLNKRLTSGFWSRDDGDFLDDIVPILKGYFVWASHVVQPTAEEMSLMKGFPIVKTEHDEDEWAPPRPLDGSAVWTREPHVVKLDDETFCVTRCMHYAEPLYNSMMVQQFTVDS